MTPPAVVEIGPFAYAVNGTTGRAAPQPCRRCVSHRAMNLLVTGPESSGTRFVSRWLEAHPELVARHWSMPSGERWARHWPDDHDFDGELPDAMILVLRSFTATVESQHHRELVDCRKEAEANATQAVLRALAWSAAHGCPVCWVLYDDIVRWPSRFDDVFRWLGLDPIPAPMPVVDANEKWLSCAS